MQCMVFEVLEEFVLQPAITLWISLEFIYFLHEEGGLRLIQVSLRLPRERLEASLESDIHHDGGPPTKQLSEFCSLAGVELQSPQGRLEVVGGALT